MTIVSILAGAAVLAASALMLAGCTPTADPQPAPSPAPSTAGLETLTGEQILEEARVAFAGARSYVFGGSRTVDGTKILGRYRMVNGDTPGTTSAGGRVTRFTIVGEDHYLLPTTASGRSSPPAPAWRERNGRRLGGRCG